MFNQITSGNIVGIGLSLVGLIDALYLTLNKLTQGKVYCANIGDCNAVNASSYADIFGIPIALLGAGAYAVFIALLYVEDTYEAGREMAQLGLFVFTLTGVIYSAYLTYIEVAVLEAICIYCLLSAALMVILFGLSVKKVLSINGGA